MGMGEGWDEPSSFLNRIGKRWEISRRCKAPQGKILISGFRTCSSLKFCLLPAEISRDGREKPPALPNSGLSDRQVRPHSENRRGHNREVTEAARSSGLSAGTPAGHTQRHSRPGNSRSRPFPEPFFPNTRGPHGSAHPPPERPPHAGTAPRMRRAATRPLRARVGRGRGQTLRGGVRPRGAGPCRRGQTLRGGARP